jgi:hypothetical protein
VRLTLGVDCRGSHASTISAACVMSSGYLH